MTILNLRYVDYSVGAYGRAKADGITLQFICDDTGEIYHSFFNVNRSRRRDTKKYKKGTILPGKRFWVTERHKFFSFWRKTCELPLPSRGLTSFHDCMGKLKSITFQAEILNGKRLVKDTLMPMDLSPKLEPADNSLINIRQPSDKTLIKGPDKNIPKYQYGSDMQQNVATCKNNHDISKQVKTYTSNPISPPKPYIEGTLNTPNQTNEEWLAEYDEG